MGPLSIICVLIHSVFGSCIAGDGQIVINEGTVTIKGRKIDWKYASFIEALGPVEREDSGIDVYDSQGIMLWKENNDTQVEEFKVVFGPNDESNSSHYAKKFYTGTVIVEGVTITKNTSLDEIRTALPQYDFQMDSETWYDGVYKDIYIFVQYDQTLQILSYLAIGHDDEDTYTR